MNFDVWTLVPWKMNDMYDMLVLGFNGQKLTFGLVDVTGDIRVKDDGRN